jgi:Fe(3+) dicitrate transport protein
MRIINPNFAVDPNLQDERGFNADVGVRGRVDGVLYWDVSAFAMNYDKRIGLMLKADAPPLYLPYRYRTNIADSRTFGVESLVEVDVWKWFLAQSFDTETPRNISLFVNTSVSDARYINTDDLSILNKEVELVPPFMLRTGATWREYVLSGMIQATAQYSYVARHFTDATNAVRTSTAVNGIIPSYAVADLSASYKYLGEGLKWTVEAGVNNLFDVRYFTRRAEGYPGPGIIPAEARSVYCTLGVVF